MLLTFSKLNVLIVDDSAADSFLIGELLDESTDIDYEYKHCELFSEAKEAMKRDEFDIVLLDLNLPDTNGVVHLEEFSRNYSNIPFIVLTGMSDREISLNALKKGANDYLVKGEFDCNLLNRSIIYALERKRSSEENMNNILKAQDREKERIARDVHDTVGQNLTSAIMQLQNIKAVLQTENKEVVDSLDISMRCINEAIQETRGIARSLMPQTVQKFGLESGIEGILLTLGEQSRVNFTFYSNLESKRFSSNVELAYFRISQETINNVLKYSQATDASIDLNYKNGILMLRIIDNGVGFDMDNPDNQKGIGLSSIRLRAKSISARILINSALEKGTTVKLALKTTEEDGKD